MHKHIARLLLRIAPPAFLHSGIRKRSFITNAASHVNAYPAVKLDIKRFYPSTLHSHVCGFFKNQMNCAPDVAGLLSSLACVTRNGLMHLPTGSPLSQILAFYSHEKMFSELDEYVRRRRGVFTVYVDDVTASLPFASAADIRAMGRIITKHGLTWHKQRLFRAGVPKLITGAIAKKGRLEAPNRQHFKYARTRDQIDQRALNVGERKLIAKSAIGLIQCIAQIDTRQKRTSIGMAKKLLLKAGL